MSLLSHLSPLGGRADASTLSARRGRVAVAACASLVFGAAAVGVTATSASAEVVAGSPAGTTSPVNATHQRVQSATSLAQTTGEPQEVTEFTDETSQVMALPDGTLELTSTRSPVRSREGETWTPINADLRPRNGRIAPAAVVGDVTFSAGGTGPLVALTEEDDPDTDAVESGTVEIVWDGDPLPSPTLQGNTATYSDVRPGVDLVLTALPSGYTQTLVLSTPAAAEGVINDPIDLHFAGDDLTFETDDAGHTTAVNGAGQTVYDGASAVLWDSHVADGASAPGSDPENVADPGDGKIMPAEASTDPNADATALAMSIAPPAEALTDTSLVYPLFLDPRLEAPRANYLTVHSRGWDYYNDSSEPMRVGYCNWAECNDAIQGTARSYMSFNIKPVVELDDTDAKIFDVAFRVTQTHNSSSSATPVELHRATTFTSTTNWPGPIGETLQTVSSAQGYGSDAGGELTFNNANVIGYIQTLANAPTPRNEGARFALKAPDEQDRNQWKKFGTNPTLTIRYSYAPTTPVGLVASGAFQCPGQDRYVDITSNTAFKAVSYTRAAAAVPIEHYFEVFRHPFSTYPDRIRYNPDPVTVSSGTYASWAPASSNSNYQPLLIDGVYSARDRARTADSATDGTDPFSAWSNWYDFTVDTVAPGKPAIKSDTYPKDYWGAAANGTGTFELSGATDVAAFSYAIDTGTTPTPNNTTCDYDAVAGAKSGYVPAASGKATLTVPPGTLTSDTHTLTVRAFDHAHNLSSTETYTFMVSPTIAGVPTANRTNRLEAGIGLTLPGEGDETTDPQTYLTEANTYTYPDPQPTFGSGGQALRITNTTAATTSDPVSTTLIFSPPVDGYYALGAGLITANHFAQLRFTLDDPSDNINPNTGEPIPDTKDPTRLEFLDASRTNPLTVDTYSAAVGAKFVALGDYLPPIADAPVPGDLQADARGVLLKGGKRYVLTVDIVGKNSASTNYNAMVDYLQLAPLRLPPYASLTAAFDNTAAGTSSATEFDGITSTTTSLSSTALTNAGITAGQNYTTTLPSGEDVTFPIPAKNGTKDNVIAQGQTITTSDPGGSNVYLLATATCGPVFGLDDPDHNVGGRTLSIYYQVNGSTERSAPEVNTVPDWRATPTNTTTVTAATTMPTHLNGPTTATGDATLYVLKFPIDNDHLGKPVTAITLPRVGTTYRNDNCAVANSGAQQLHVFSMAIQ